MKKILSLAVAGLVMFLLLAPVVSAAEFITSSDKQGNLTLSSTETHHNAYVAGGSVFVNSATTGDLYAAGGSLTIEGPVEQDLVVAGGNITINAPVGGDVRVAGGTVIINGKISGDLVVAGGTVTVTEKGSVGSDVAVAGGQVIFDGPVAGHMQIAANQVTINSNVYGNVDVIADQSLTFGPKAVISTKINYKGVKDAEVKEGAQISEMNYTALPNRAKGENARHAVAALFTVVSIIKMIGLIIVGLILMKLFPRSSNELVHSLMNRPWLNLLVGFIGVVVTPIAVIILMITFVGFYVGMIAFVTWLLSLILSAVVLCVFTGTWLIKVIGKHSTVKVDWQALVLGTIVVGIISVIPVIGMLVIFVLLMMSFGSMVRHLAAYIKKEQDSVRSVPPVDPINPTIV